MIAAVQTSKLQPPPAVEQEMKPEKEKQNITFLVSPAYHRVLRQYALDNRTSMQKMLEEAMSDFCVKKGIPMEDVGK